MKACWSTCHAAVVTHHRRCAVSRKAYQWQQRHQPGDDLLESQALWLMGQATAGF